MKRTTRRLLAILLCIAILPVDGFAAWATEKSPEPPKYMRALSRLVAATASEDDFGEIQLVIGEPEMDVDGETKPIADDEHIVPFVDKNDELQIPAEVISEADLNGSGFLSQEELENAGYAVSFNADAGSIRITEPYGLCRLIVKTENGKVKHTYGATQKLAVSDNRTVLQYADKESTAQAAKQLHADPSVLSCVPDRLVSIDAQPTETTPNDAFVNYPGPRCWGTHRARADVWMNEHADDELAEVVVALIDTGVEATHPFLEGRVLSTGWDFVGDDNDPTDDHSHGTHCAGIIRDATPANVKILPVKIIGAGGTGSNAVAYEGIRWAVDQGADILSMSFGCTPDGDEADDPDFIESWLASDGETIQYAYDAGVTCVAAAGNDIQSLDEHPITPAVLPHVITVASIGETDLPSFFSNWGSMVDVCAPGEAIVSSVLNGKYQAYNGTSMATPLAAAVCANFLSTDKTQTPDDILQAVLSRAEDVGEPGWDEHCGAGCVSMHDFTPLAGLSLPYETMRLPIGINFQIRPVFSPSDASTRTVTFLSSAPDVASVDNLGNIQTKNSGVAVISAVSTDGGFTAQCTVTVLGGSGVRDVFATAENMFVHRTDGTVHYNGIGFHTQELGNTSGFFGSWGIVRDQKRMPIDGITQFWELPYYDYHGAVIADISSQAQAYYTKEDGKLYRIEEDGSSVIQKTISGKPLTGVTEMQRSYYAVFALNETGAVYTCCDGVWQPVLKEDGSMLENIRHIGGHAAFCADGSVWFLSQTEQSYCTLAVPYAPVPEAVDGFILAGFSSSGWQPTGVFQPQTVVLLRADGTVWGAGDNTNNFLGSPDLLSTDTPVPVTLEDGQPLCGVCAVHCNGFGIFALREDGTVIAWGAASNRCNQKSYLGVGQSVTSPLPPMPVVDEDLLPLTGVKALLRAYGGRMLFLREDDSVWICGFVEYALNGSKIENIYAVPFTISDDPVYLLDLPMEPFEKIVPAQRVVINADRIFLGIGDTFRIDAHVLPENADNPQVTYTVKDGYGANVDGKGMVTGWYEGTTTIRVGAVEAPNDVYADCIVTVGSAKIASVSVGKLPDKTVYNRGELLDTDGGELRLLLENGVVEYVPLLLRHCSGYDPQRAGWQRIMIDYVGLTASFSIYVRQKEAVCVTLTKPYKTEYLLGEEFDLTGGALTILYDDGSKSTVPLTEEMCSSFDNNKDDVQKIHVQWLGQDLFFLVSVHAPRICGIEIYTLPDKLDYANETQIDPAGGEIVYVYDDGSQGEIFPLTGQMCDSSALRRLGEQDVAVRFDGFTTTFPVYVHAVEGASLSMRTLPAVRYYSFSGTTTVDPRGATALLRYADGTREIVEITKSMCSLPENRNITAKSWTVAVSYLGLTTSFTIYNYKTALGFATDHIEMARLPDETEIRQYRTLRPDGGVVRLCGADGQRMNVTLSQTMLSADNTFTVGERTVKVSIENCQTSFQIRVLPSIEYKLVKPPDKTVYCLGEVFNTVGLTYTQTQYGDPDEPAFVGEGSVIPSTWCTGFNTKQIGKQTVSVKPEYQRPLQFTIYVTDMTLDCDTPLLQCGQSTWVRPVFRYAMETPELTWTSSDKSVAKVSRDGRVTAVGVGTAEITAKVNDFCSAACTITVQEEAVEPDGLVFVQAPKELLPDDSVQILVSAMPLNAAARPITWTSSDPSILSVDNTGTVTAIRTGTAEITAQIEGGGAATCTVTVTDHLADYTFGDADGDGKITLKDVTQIARYLAGGWNTEIHMQSADVNGDGLVDLKDVVLLRRYLAGGWGIVL